MSTTACASFVYGRTSRVVGLAGALTGHGGLVILALLFLSQTPAIPLPPPVEATTIALQVVAPQKKVSQPAPVEPPKPVPVSKPAVQPAKSAPIEPVKPKRAVTPPVPKPALQPLPEPVHSSVRQSSEPAPVPAPRPVTQPAQMANTGQPTAPPDTQAKQTLLSYLVAQIEKHKRYPAQARRRGIEGTVRMKVSIDSAGNLLAISVLDGADPLLAKATQSVANKIREQWKSSGSGASVSVIVPLRYSLVE